MIPPKHCTRCSTEEHKFLLRYSNDGDSWTCAHCERFEYFGKDDVNSINIFINGYYIFLSFYKEEYTTIININSNTFIKEFPELMLNLLDMTDEELLDWLQMIVIFS